MSGSFRELALADIVGELPGVGAFSSNPSAARDLDVWIATLGFEERCYAVGNALADEGARAAHVLICTYETNTADNQANADAIIECARRLGRDPEWIAADQLGFADALRRRLRALRDDAARPLRVAWDMSAASNEVTVILASVLFETDCDLEVMYAEAAVYFPTILEYQSDPGRWHGEERMGLDQGTLNIRISSEHPGEHSSQLPHHLVVIPGYSRDRVRRVISRIEAAFLDDLPGAPITWMIGTPHKAADAWRRQALLEIHAVPREHDPVELSTFHYTDTMNELERVHVQWGLKRNITLCPMGSKLQALGCALFCRSRPDVRVMFAQPEQYNASHYTEGVSHLWSVVFGRVDVLDARLGEVGTLVRSSTCEG
ncbi:hypothetical protein [Gaiella sp.]|uniref:hypothetical protein n=1 Tax=Gaiella sp. TaxID=2663207 RepID=UPI0039835D6D